jgi:hypothetical protein
MRTMPMPLRVFGFGTHTKMTSSGECTNALAGTGYDTSGADGVLLQVRDTKRASSRALQIEFSDLILFLCLV